MKSKKKARRVKKENNIKQKNKSEIENIEKQDQPNNEKDKKQGKHFNAKKCNKKEKNSTKEQKVQSDKKESSKHKIFKLKYIAIFIVAVCIVAIGIFAYLALRPKFHDVTIELGTSEVTIDEFLVSNIYKSGAVTVTDLNSLDLGQVQTLNVVFSFKGKEETVKLNIVDTTAPMVVVQDIYKYLDYIINPDDFIVSKEDYSEMTVEIINEVEFTDYGTYPVTIKVSDAYGNETIEECNLTITWLLSNVNIEMGSEFSVEDIVIDPDRFGSLVPENEIAKVNTMELGTYELYIDIDGTSYTSTVIVQDTTPPNLQVKNLTIWNDQTVSGFESFIVSATDISGEVTTESSTNIDYSIIGNQNIVIKATDVNGNSVEQTAILTIKKDTTGPVFSGLSNLSIKKNGTVNYESGVSATDNKDGSVLFSVDSSAVDTSTAGTYYATYTSKDSSGNTTTSKRKVEVKWDYSDVTAKVNQFYNSYCSGLDAAGIASVVKNKIKYSSADYGGGNSSVYYGLVNGTGNCYVHASILHHLLAKAGYSDKIIRLKNNAHYWNYCNGVHYDSTPGNNHVLVAYSDEEKAAETYMVNHSYTIDDFVF